LGIFTGISNLADLPGSIVRDLIGGENPLDQLLNPFGDVDRLTTEEVTGVGGIPGFLLELGMDPLTYLGGAGLLKALPKIIRARRGAGAIKGKRLSRQLAGRAGAETRREKKIQALKDSLADVLGQPSSSGITEDMLGAAGVVVPKALKKYRPDRTGVLSRIGKGYKSRGLRGAAGGAASPITRRARHLWRQSRRLPGSTQAILAGKASPAWLEEMFDDNPELRNILQEQSGGTNEPLNTSTPLEILQMNLPGPEYYAPTDPMENLSGPDPASGSYELPYYMPRVSAPDDLGY